ncbi:MAG TPA: hypothetical protein DCW90_17100 [Lachnospiraceae bacterium]|mgnify:CR=1 FL=1|nr:hypothetical protein [Lachnospiraceae bacterium]
MATVELDSYSIHKQLYSKVDPPDEQTLKTQLASVGAWFSTNLKCNDYTLMCREKYDFTVLHFEDMNYDKGTQEVRSLLESRGTIMDIAYSHATGGYECWVKDSENEVSMYLLFESPWIIVNV